MHFGNIVKATADKYNFSNDDLAWLMGRPVDEIERLLAAEEWTSGNIKAASDALNYDFGTHLNHSVE